MANTKHIETFSIIIKEEKVKTLTHNLIPNTFALEIISPLPGYYGSEYLISREKPGHVLFITKDYIHFEDFFRINKKIKSYLNFGFDATFATVTVNNNSYYALRIKDVENYEQIEELQQAFVAEGVKMGRPKRVESMALIRVKKFLSLQTKGDGIYYHTSKNTYKYLEIEKPVTWKLFEKITMRIRHNMPGVKFDVALAVLFRTGDLLDVIRVYSDDISEEDLRTLHKNYLLALKEY
jgi:hypothetical protein